MCQVSNAAHTTHKCVCIAGWVGAQCDIIDPCHPSCGHGTCVKPLDTTAVVSGEAALIDSGISVAQGATADLDLIGTCVCEGEYSGEHCENDPCHNIDCGVAMCQGAYTGGLPSAMFSCRFNCSSVCVSIRISRCCFRSRWNVAQLRLRRVMLDEPPMLWSRVWEPWELQPRQLRMRGTLLWRVMRDARLVLRNRLWPAWELQPRQL